MSNCDTLLYRQKQLGPKIGGIAGFDCTNCIEILLYEIVHTLYKDSIQIV